ncbi:MAG: stage III sporulation protein AD [Lachnospiraceae bacterium]|nr:stage III sporulation protein AD [Lachnospiraceae bacterium]MDE6627293.1 stage III sporulation protein AD [Lachnospiraceae bacterium]
MGFFKIIIGVIIGVLLALKLKNLNSSMWIYLSLALSMFVLFYILNRLQFVLDFLDDVMGDIGLESGYFEILIKIIGISYLCEFTANICRESGFVAVAGQIEIGGKLTMMVMSMPILMAIVETITSIL